LAAPLGFGGGAEIFFILIALALRIGAGADPAGGLFFVAAGGFSVRRCFNRCASKSPGLVHPITPLPALAISRIGVYVR
jgi:hypothetical protein